MSRFLNGAALGALPIVTICVFAPLAIYAGNPEEFTASYTELILTVLPYGLGLCLLCGLAVLPMSESGVSRFAAVVGALAILVWLQGNILVWDYGPLDGHSINWLLGVWRGLLDTAIWIVLIRLAILSHERYGRLLVQGAAATVVIQLIASGLLLGSNEDLALTHSDVEENAQARQAVTGFSGSLNVLHIVMDGFQTDLFRDIVEDPANSAYKEHLKGFTLFESNVGPYPYTQMTVPALLTGKLYLNQVPAEEFIDRTLGEKTILGAAADAGFEVDIAAPVALKNTYARSSHTNAYGISSSDHVAPRQLIQSDAARLMDLSIFRVVPHFAKALVYRQDLWLFQAGINARSYLHIQYFSDLAFIRELTEELAVDRNTPVYKLMHFMLSHRPTVGDQNCSYDGRRRTNRDNVRIQAGCGLEAVLGLLARMQALGIYESSLIILMGDHGAWVPVERSVEAGAAIDAVGIAMATPVLAIKPPGAGHAFEVSVAPTSIVDVPATVADLLKLDADFEGESVFALGTGVPRERRHFNYEYGPNAEHDGYLMELQEFVTDGSPFDAASWRRGRSYPPRSKISESDPAD